MPVQDQQGQRIADRAAPVLLTVRELAEMLHIGLSTAYRLCEEGQLPVVRIGGVGRRGAIRVRLDDVLAWLERKSSVCA